MCQNLHRHRGNDVTKASRRRDQYFAGKILGKSRPSPRFFYNFLSQLLDARFSENFKPTYSRGSLPQPGNLDQYSALFIWKHKWTKLVDGAKIPLVNKLNQTYTTVSLETCRYILNTTSMLWLHVDETTNSFFFTFLQVVLFWLCLTVVTRLKMAFHTVGVQEKICVIQPGQIIASSLYLTFF